MEFPAGNYVVKEIEGDNDDVQKKKKEKKKKKKEKKERVHVHAERTGMNMKNELIKLLEIKK